MKTVFVPALASLATGIGSARLLLSSNTSDTVDYGVAALAGAAAAYALSRNLKLAVVGAGLGALGKYLSDALITANLS